MDVGAFLRFATLAVSGFTMGFAVDQRGAGGDEEGELKFIMGS